MRDRRPFCGGAVARSFAVPAFVLVVAGVVVCGCSKSDSTSAAASASASGAVGAALAAAPSVARPRPIALTAEPEKVWGSGASLAAGITSTELDSGRIAIGVYDGRGPDVVVFDAKGEGQEIRIREKKELTSELKKGDKREILRVTPALGSGGEVVAFVDYREVGDARRLVSCGPSDSNDDLLKFEGKPLIDTGEEPGEKVGGGVRASAAPGGGVEPPTKAKSEEAAKPAAPAASAKPAATSGAKPSAGKPAATNPAGPKPPVVKIDSAPKPAPKSAAKPPVAPAPAPSPAPSSTEPRELRECRTLVDRGGAHVWSVGSELVGKPAADGTEWSIVLFTEQERGRGRADLSTSPVGRKPLKLFAHEAMTAYEIGGGNFVLTARFRGALGAWVLDSSKHARGPARVYGSGYPSEPHFANLGSELALLVVQTGADNQKTARAARFAADVTSLPATLSDLVIPDRAVEPPVTAVSLTAPPALAGQRLLAYVSDEAARRLSIVQVDANLAAAGEPLPVDVGVREAELFALGDGRLLVVYVRVDPSGHSQLVSKTVKLS